MYKLKVAYAETNTVRMLKNDKDYQVVLNACLQHAMFAMSHGKHVVLKDNGFNVLGPDGKVNRGYRITEV